MTNQVAQPGAELKLLLSIGSYDLSLKGEVRHADPQEGMGIKFHEIRKGDRQILQFLLRKLSEKQFEDTLRCELQAQVVEQRLSTALMSCHFRSRPFLFNVLQPRSFASETAKVIKLRTPYFRRANKLNLVDHS